MSYEIEVTDECIACGACAAASPNFKVEDGKAHPVKTPIDDSELEDNNKGMEACPVNAIKINKVE